MRYQSEKEKKKSMHIYSSISQEIQEDQRHSDKKGIACLEIAVFFFSANQLASR